jgi:hypothetical protein
MYKVQCEIYSRVAGYYRPVKQFNKGKQAEFWDRVNFKVPLPVTSGAVSELHYTGEVAGEVVTN